MKILFRSRKELFSDVDKHLKVLYAPSKRTTNNLRWYLLLAAVLTPFAYVMATMFAATFNPDLPGQLVVATTELRANLNGKVKRILVKPGDKIESNQMLVELDSPELRLKLDKLRPFTSEIAIEAATAQQIAANSINLQNEVVQLFESLHREGAMSSAELLESEVQLNSQKLSLLKLNRQLLIDQMTLDGTPVDNLRQEREREWLTNQLGQLTLYSTGEGRVAELLVNEGEYVGSGTLLMRIEQANEPLIWIYLKPNLGPRATAGQRLKVRLPDGKWLRAVVIDQSDLARRLPTGLNTGLRSDRLALQVPARFLEPLPVGWRVNQLPLDVRFD